jgi:hypothetical protein
MEEGPLTNRLQVAKKQQQRDIINNNIGEDEDPNFDRKLDLITAGARPFVKKHLLTKITRENCQIIINYILAMQTELSPAQTYRVDTINKLKRFAEFHNPKSFRDITRQDIVDFLDSLRKSPTESYLSSPGPSNMANLSVFKNRHHYLFLYPHQPRHNLLLLCM